jgi:hypothetical protein
VIRVMLKNLRTVTEHAGLHASGNIAPAGIALGMQWGPSSLALQDRQQRSIMQHQHSAMQLHRATRLTQATSAHTDQAASAAIHPTNEQSASYGMHMSGHYHHDYHHQYQQQQTRHDRAAALAWPEEPCQPAWINQGSFAFHHTNAMSRPGASFEWAQPAGNSQGGSPWAPTQGTNLGVENSTRSYSMSEIPTPSRFDIASFTMPGNGSALSEMHDSCSELADSSLAKSAPAVTEFEFAPMQQTQNASQQAALPACRGEMTSRTASSMPGTQQQVAAEGGATRRLCEVRGKSRFTARRIFFSLDAMMFGLLFSCTVAFTCQRHQEILRGARVGLWLVTYADDSSRGQLVRVLCALKS